MKIFSLQSKTNIAVWSVVVGLILALLIIWVTSLDVEFAGRGMGPGIGMHWSRVWYLGWPYAMTLVSSYHLSDLAVLLLLNGLFWFVIIFVWLLINRLIKDNLVVWATIFGSVVCLIIDFFTWHIGGGCGDSLSCSIPIIKSFGWPIRSSLYGPIGGFSWEPTFFFNIIFWSFLSLILFSVIRSFKYKNKLPKNV